MPVEIIKGDMVLSYKNKELDAYAHQCNCFCTMKRGIAVLLSKVNPEVRRSDNLTTVGNRDKLGKLGQVHTKGFPILFNVYSQYHWREYKEPYGGNTDYSALHKGLVSIKKTLYGYIHNPKGSLTLGLPLIGCGLAGGDWDNVVYPMIKEIFEDSNIYVTVFIL